jgi:hypothetical protein
MTEYRNFISKTNIIGEVGKLVYVNVIMVFSQTLEMV